MDACGYDAGDCGPDKLEQLYRLTVTSADNGTVLTLPQGKVSA